MWRIQKWVSRWASKEANKQERWWSACTMHTICVCGMLRYMCMCMCVFVFVACALLYFDSYHLFETQGSDITYVEKNKQHCQNAMCWSRSKPQMCGNPKLSALCWTTKGTPPQCANPNHQHETCWALCNLTSMIWLELIPIHIHEVQCPKIVVHEGFGHLQIICWVQTGVCQSLAHSHIGFLNHCVFPPLDWESLLFSTRWCK